MTFFQSRKHQLLALILLALLAYSNSFKTPFLNDDNGYISENPLIKDFKHLVSGVFGDDAVANGNVITSMTTRRVVFASFWANLAVNGLDPTGYHVVNFLIHAINGLIVYYMMLYLFATPSMQSSIRKPRPDIFAFLTAMLFLLHPIQTESVTYISQRFTSLSSLFYMLSAMLYLKLRNEVEITGGKASKLLYTTAFASAVLAMFSKENSFTLPFIIILIEGIFYSGKSILPVKSRIAMSGWFLALLPIIPISRTMDSGYSFSVFIDAASRTTPLPRLTYLFTQFRVIVKYLGLLIWPQGLCISHMIAPSKSFFEPVVMVSFLLLSAIVSFGIFALIASRRSDSAMLRLAAFGIFWFFIAISVESSIIPLDDLIFEHRLYLPSFGFFVALLAALFYYFGKTEKRSIRLTASILLIGLALAGATFERNDVWRSAISLWGDAALKYPNNIKAVRGLAGSYFSANKHGLAIQTLTEAEPNLPEFRSQIYSDLGMIYMDQGLEMIAVEKYEAALRIDWKNWQAHRQMALYYLRQGDLDKSISEFELASKFNTTEHDRKRERFFIDKLKKSRESKH